MSVIHRKVSGKWEWEGVSRVTYDKPTVRGVAKHVLIGPKDGAAGIALRYFEVQPGGNSAHESHPEIHEVFIVHGRGKVLLGDTYHDIAAGDAIYISAHEQHELRADAGVPLGFLCAATIA